MPDPNPKNQVNSPYQGEAADDEIHLIDLIYPIFKRIKFLVGFCIFIVAVTGIISFLMPKTYRAVTVILPEAREGAEGAQMQSAFLEQFGIAGYGGSTATPSELFGAVLNSNDLAEDVLGRYDYFFTKGIHKNKIKKASESFAGQLEVDQSKTEPTISIAVESHDPVLAADIVNSYVIALDEYNRTNSLTSAQRLRKYIEDRLDAANKELESAQEELREFQEKNKAFSISKQAEATLTVLSEMESKLVELEVQKAAQERFYRGTHVEIEQIKAKMDALQKNIDRLSHSKEPQVPLEQDRERVEFYIPLTRIPALNFDESRLLLKVRAKTGVVTMLTTQLEQAKLDEARDMPTVNVLDRANVPEIPIKPNLKLNVLLAGVAGLFIGVVLIFLMEFLHRVESDPDASPKWREMKTDLRNTVLFFKRKK